MLRDPCLLIRYPSSRSTEYDRRDRGSTEFEYRRKFTLTRQCDSQRNATVVHEQADTVGKRTVRGPASGLFLPGSQIARKRTGTENSSHHAVQYRQLGYVTQYQSS